MQRGQILERQGKPWEGGCHEMTRSEAETFLSGPGGTSPPGKGSHQPEASLATGAGDRDDEA